MANAKVQSTFLRTTTGTVAKAFTSNNTAGNCLIARVMIESDTATITSLVDSAGNTWTGIDTLVGDGNGRRMRLYYAKNCLAGANTVTLTISAAVGADLSIYEWSGLDTTAPLNASAAPVGGTGATATSGNLTTTAANCLLFAAAVCNQQLSTGTGFTTQENNNFNYSTWDESFSLTATGTYNATENVIAASVWVMAAAAFKEGAVAASTLPSRSLLGVGI